jgi:glycosyltransferase involved in cell wall biosynthesis
MESPLLSIVIPTKDRIKYLVPCLKSLQRIDSENFEIVVHDNSVVDIESELSDFLIDPRIKYYHTSEKLSGVDNFDQAISKATGKYVMVLGDDDSCSGAIIDEIQILDQENFVAFFSPKAIFFWPDITFKYFANKFSGQLFINSFTGKKRHLDAAKEREKCLQSGACEIFNLPRVYHGVVRREVLEKIKSIAKAYSPGPSPDIANAIALSHVIETFIYVDKPFVITGNAAKSGAGMGTARRHIGKIGTISFLPANAEEIWSELVPRFWSGQTVWAQSVIQSMEACGNDSYVINLPLLHAKTFVFNSNYRQEVIQNYWILSRRMNKNKIIWATRFFFGWIHANFTRIKPLLIKIPYLLGFNKSYRQQRFLNLNSIYEASIKLDKVLKISR